MKNIFELADTTSADVTAITPKVISATVEEIARGKRVFAQFYKINRDLVTSGGTQVEFPKKGSGVVVQTNLSAGDTLNTGNMIYTATTIPIKKHGIGLGFYGEAIRQVKRDVIKDAIQEAGESWADAEDTVALEAMFPLGIFSTSGAGTINAAGTLVIGVKRILGTVTSMVITSTDTQFVCDSGATIQAWYVPTSIGARNTTQNNNTLSPRDLWEAKIDIVGKNYNPDIMVINPERIGDIIYSPAEKMIESWVYRNEGPLLNGEVGKLFGMKVIATTKAPLYGVALIDSQALGYKVERMGLELKKDEFSGLKTDMLYFFGFAEYNFGVVNPDAYGAVVMKGSFSPIMVNPTR